MKSRTGLGWGLLIVVLSNAASADTVKRSVDSQGVPVIRIHGSQSEEVVRKTVPAAKKEFQVYQLEGEGRPPQPEDSAEEVVAIPAPPPIAPNPAAYGYGYGYGYGYDYPWFAPGGGYCPPWQPNPLNYQNPPANYQNPPSNYQNPPANYQSPVPRQNYRGR